MVTRVHVGGMENADRLEPQEKLVMRVSRVNRATLAVQDEED